MINTCSALYDRKRVELTTNEAGLEAQSETGDFQALGMGQEVLIPD